MFSKLASTKKPLFHAINFSISIVSLYFLSANTFAKHLGSSNQTLLEGFDPNQPQFSDTPLILTFLCSGMYFFVNTRSFYYKLNLSSSPQKDNRIWDFLEIGTALYKTIVGSSSQFALIHDGLDQVSDDADKNLPLAINLLVTFVSCISNFMVQWQLLGVQQTKEKVKSRPPGTIYLMTTAYSITNTIIYFNQFNNSLATILEALDLYSTKGQRFTDLRNPIDVSITSINTLLSMALLMCNHTFAYVSICQKMQYDIPSSQLSPRGRSFKTILLYMSVMDKALIGALSFIATPEPKSKQDLMIKAAIAASGLYSSALCIYRQYKPAVLGDDLSKSTAEKQPLLINEEKTTAQNV